MEDFNKTSPSGLLTRSHKSMLFEQLKEKLNLIIREFEGDYIVNGKIVDNSPVSFIHSYEYAKECLELIKRNNENKRTNNNIVTTERI